MRTIGLHQAFINPRRAVLRQGRTGRQLRVFGKKVCREQAIAVGMVEGIGVKGLAIFYRLAAQKGAGELPRSGGFARRNPATGNRRGELTARGFLAGSPLWGKLAQKSPQRRKERAKEPTQRPATGGGGLLPAVFGGGQCECRLGFSQHSAEPIARGFVD